MGNRSYGIKAASNTYFNKELNELTIAESATIASMAQLPSRVNPVKNPRRTKQRRNWILSRMLLLNYIDEEQYSQAISEEIKIVKNINIYDVDGGHLAELARQEVISRYGLKAYSEGWSVYTTLDSKSQNKAKSSLIDQLYAYDKRHGWKEPNNYSDIFDEHAQEAHEAIRPTDVSRTPNNMKKFLSTDQIKLYELIWSRALSSQNGVG